MAKGQLHSGMLWFDNNPKTDLADKVERAAAYYLKKYGLEPDTCLVNPEMMAGKNIIRGQVTIKGNRAILMHHLWIGRKDEGNAQS